MSALPESTAYSPSVFLDFTRYLPVLNIQVLADRQTLPDSTDARWLLPGELGGLNTTEGLSDIIASAYQRMQAASI